VLTATPRRASGMEVLSGLAKVFMAHKKLCFPEPMWGCRLAWSRLVDLGSIDPGSNPGSPILSNPFRVELMLFNELPVENCIINCFKWFSNVLLRLKPSSFDFSTRSLSRYNTTLPLFVNYICTRAQANGCSLSYVCSFESAVIS
jgi:hypothetical protein